MASQFQRFVAIVLLVPISILGIVSALELLVRSHVWDTDVASALGTVGAFVGAIWISFQGERRRRIEAHDRAIIAAADLAPRVKEAAINLGMLHRYSISEEYRMDSTAKVRSVVGSLRDLQIWTNEEILPLVILPQRIGARLISTRVALMEFKDLYDRLAESPMDYKIKRLKNEPILEAHSAMEPVASELQVLADTLDRLVSDS